MSLFVIGMLVIVVGYFTYGRFVDKFFDVDPNRITCACEMEDGVDYVPMSTPKLFLIQLLNIAGLGPIFGAIQGALFGPSAFVWIALGTVFAGGVHDYFSGMLSVRNRGASISEISGEYLGDGARKLMRVFSVILLVLTGTVFMTGPASLLANLEFLGLSSLNIWLAIIFVYYVLATVVPVDKIIGKIYPFFGATLLTMAAGVGGGLLIGDFKLPDFQFTSMHPQGLPVWAMLFTTIACGAISGFHSTQSPMMARCLKNEKNGRQVFYGAMAAEGIIAMIWAAAAMSYFGGVPQLGQFLAEGGGPGGVVNEISFGIMGKIGGILAMIGVIVCPITSGDTAFRSARLTIADATDLDQGAKKNRIVLAIPLFIIAFILTRLDFSIIWRYFAFSNQALATIVLWTASAYLAMKNKSTLITTLPAVFMTFVCSTYILQAPEGFRLATTIAYPLGAAIAIGICAAMIVKIRKIKGNNIRLT